MSFAPTLTSFNDQSPSPRVQVVFSTVATGTETINVWRTQEGRTYPVAGGVNLFAVGGANVLDLEVGLGIPVSYQAEQFDISGNSLGFTDSTTVTLSGGAAALSWISQPLSPILAVPVHIFTTSSSAVQRVNPGQFLTPEGSTVGTWVGGQRQGIQGMGFGFRVNNSSDADELLSMFGSYTTDFPSVVCIRTPPPARLPRTLFLASTGPVENAQANFTYMSYTLAGNEVARPSPGLIVPLLRREDVDANYTTRAAMSAAYATRLAMDSDYSLAGLAGP